jgi:hypothetical protein
MPAAWRPLTTSPSRRNDHTTASAGCATWAMPMVPIWIVFCAYTSSPWAVTPLVSVRINMYVHPVPLMPKTSPLAIARGSTATAAIGQIVAMNVVTSISRRKRLVVATYPTSSSIAVRPNTLP